MDDQSTNQKQAWSLTRGSPRSSNFCLFLLLNVSGSTSFLSFSCWSKDADQIPIVLSQDPLAIYNIRVTWWSDEKKELTSWQLVARHKTPSRCPVQLNLGFNFSPIFFQMMIFWSIDAEAKARSSPDDLIVIGRNWWDIY